MSCCNPVTHKVKTKGGMWKVVTHGCGKCEQCLKKRSRDWVYRCSWEARKYPYNWIVTLTYRDEFLHFTKKGNATLCKDDFQRFMKRLRKRYSPHKIRYLVRGEYGGKFGRPHYHLILFGFPATSVNEVGFILSDEWPYGGVYVDSYSDRAVQYVTDYILKADDLSVYHDDELVLPYINVSQRPMIGANFLDSPTCRRAIRTNDYMLLAEDNTKYHVPRAFVKKCDEIATDDPIEQKYRSYSRAKEFDKCPSDTHYSDKYPLYREVLRAEAIESKKHRDYIRNKGKI